MMIYKHLTPITLFLALVTQNQTTAKPPQDDGIVFHPYYRFNSSSVDAPIASPDGTFAISTRDPRNNNYKITVIRSDAVHFDLSPESVTFFSRPNNFSSSQWNMTPVAFEGDVVYGNISPARRPGEEKPSAFPMACRVNLKTGQGEVILHNNPRLDIVKAVGSFQDKIMYEASSSQKDSGEKPRVCIQDALSATNMFGITDLKIDSAAGAPIYMGSDDRYWYVMQIGEHPVVLAGNDSERFSFPIPDDQNIAAVAGCMGDKLCVAAWGKKGETTAGWLDQSGNFKPLDIMSVAAQNGGRIELCASNGRYIAGSITAKTKCWGFVINTTTGKTSFLPGIKPCAFVPKSDNKIVAIVNDSVGIIEAINGFAPTPQDKWPQPDKHTSLGKSGLKL